MAFRTVLGFCLLVGVVSASPSASDVFADIYSGCLQHASFSCVKPKALSWLSQVADDDVIRVTDDLTIVKDPTVAPEEQRGVQDIYDKFESFLDSHRLVASVPAPLRPGGELNEFVPRAFDSEDVNVPLSPEPRGKSKIVKKVLVPFLLGLKFKTAVLVPLALALIALKTWKAMTLGLLSLVLTGAMLIFKFSKPKVVNYEVVHVPHHVDHHIEHAVPAAWEHHGYGRELTGNQMAYRAYEP